MRTTRVRMFRSKDSLALGLALLVIVGYIIVSSALLENDYLDQKLFFGSIVGILCGAYVICRLWTDPRFQTPMMKLMFYRVMAELGLSARFLFSPLVNHRLCGDWRGCDIKEQELNEHRCAPWSATLQFFLIASEMWFLCIAFDFAVTLSNPFSPFKDRLKKYHVFCWGTALVMAMIVGADDDILGVWYASSDVASDTICWIEVPQGDVTDVNTNLWALFYVPLLLIYLYAIYVTCCAYSVLSHGIQVTFLHRARVLFFSQLLLVIYSSYWVFLLLLYLGIFASERTSLWHWMLFFIPARGILGLIVLFCTQYTKLFSDQANPQDTEADKTTAPPEEFFDLNSALQNEIVAFATVGIKESAVLTHSSSRPQIPSESLSATSLQEHHFWIKIPEQVVQLQNLRNLVDTVDAEFSDIMRGFAESRSIAKLKALLYQEPRNVQFDERSSLSEGERGTDSRRSVSVSAFNGGERVTEVHTTGEKATELRTSGGSAHEGGGEQKHKTPQTPPALTLQQLLSPELAERHSTTAPLLVPPSTPSLFSSICSSLRLAASSLHLFLRRHSILLSSTPSLVHFTEYSPAVFYDIRALYGLEQTYPESFEAPIKLHLAEGGASSALFFFSECKRSMAKSCTAQEMRNIRKHATSLRGHFQEHRGSLITRIFGAYKLQVHSSDLYFIVTNNVLLTAADEVITEKFDLKGSSVHRHMKLPRSGETVRCRLCGSAFRYNAKNHLRRDGGDSSNSFDNSIITSSSDSSDDAAAAAASTTTPPCDSSFRKTLSRRVSRRISTTTPVKIDTVTDTNTNKSIICPLFRHEPDAVLKDNDMRGKAKLRLPAQEGDRLLEQLHVDCEFLAGVYEVMDYSLLVGVYKKVIEIDADSTASPLSESGNSGNSTATGLFQGGLDTRWKAGEFVVDYSYYMGIIDYQQPYSLRKKLETWYKVNILRSPREEISCLPPGPYKDRFLDFMEDLIF